MAWRRWPWRGLAFVAGAANLSACTLAAPLDGLTGGVDNLDVDGATPNDAADGGFGVSDATTSDGQPRDSGARTDSMLASGTDSGAETSALPDAGVQPDGSSLPLSPGDLRFYYASAQGGVGQRAWSYATQTWAAPVTIGSYASGVVPWTRPAIDVSSGAELLGVVDAITIPTLDLFRNASGWPHETVASGLGQTAHRGFDVAYLSSSGGAIAVYGGGTAIPLYAKNVGGSWSTPQPIATSSPGSAPADWVMLAAHPRTDEVTLVYTDTNQLLYGATWTGTAWSGPPTALDTSGLNVADFAGFAVAYENVSGDALVMWSPPSTCSSGHEQVLYSTKPSGSSTFSAKQAYGNFAGPGALVAASEPGTDRIAFSCVEYCNGCGAQGCNDFSAGVWGGSSWAAVNDLDGAIGID